MDLWEAALSLARAGMPLPGDFGDTLTSDIEIVPGRMLAFFLFSRYPVQQHQSPTRNQGCCSKVEEEKCGGEVSTSALQAC